MILHSLDRQMTFLRWKIGQLVILLLTDKTTQPIQIWLSKFEKSGSIHEQITVSEIKCFFEIQIGG